MAVARASDCLVGFELSGTAIRIAAITGPDARAPETRRLICDEMLIPERETCGPAELPPASVLAPALKAAFSRMGVGGGRAAVAVGPPRMVLRHFVGRDDQVRANLEQATERSLSYVQLGIGARVAAESFHKLGEDRAHGLLAVSSAALITPLAEALEQAGMRVQTIEPAILSLTRLAAITGQLQPEASFLVCEDAESVEIALVCGGHVLFSHRPLSLGPGRHEPQERPSELKGTLTLRRELERISRHYLRTFGAAETVRSAVLCGRSDWVRSCVSELNDIPDFRAEALELGTLETTALQVSSGAAEVLESHATCLGAAAALCAEVAEVSGPNLASTPEEQRRPRFEALVRALWLPTLVAAGVWGSAALVETRLESKVDRLRIEVEHPSAVEAKYREFQMELNLLEQRATRLTGLSDRYGDQHWKELLDTVRICVPDRLWLTRVRLGRDHQLTLEGAAHDESLVYDFAKNLEGAPVFESATITTQTSSREGNAIVNKFSVECKMLTDFAAPGASDS